MPGPSPRLSPAVHGRNPGAAATLRWCPQTALAAVVSRTGVRRGAATPARDPRPPAARPIHALLSHTPVKSLLALVALASTLGLWLGSAELRAASDGEPVPPLPQRLEDTGLFVQGSTAVRQELLAFTPQYPLWSDGATKRRWMSLPPGAVIDASDPDAWRFPVGTRFWKEFSHQGHPIETRYIERLPGGWRYATYVWDEVGGEARLAPAGGIAALPRAVAPGGRYPVPSEDDCRACHEGARVPILGFGALQLSPERDALAPHAEAGTVDLRALVERGWLRGLPAALLERPPRIEAASRTERAALGYLHANCGHCHHRGESAVPVALALAQDADGRDAGWRAAIGAPSRYRAPGTAATLLIAPGDARASVLSLRLRSRDPHVQMPPLGNLVSDPVGTALVDAWIDAIPPTMSPETSPPKKETRQ